MSASLVELGYLQAQVDEAFNKMRNEWLIGGIGKMCGSRGGGKFALDNGTEWGRTWARWLRELRALEKQLGTDLGDVWWYEKLGMIGERRELTRMAIALQTRPRPGAWRL